MPVPHSRASQPFYRRWLALCLIHLTAAAVTLGATTYHDLEQPPNNYFQRTPSDRFTQLKAKLEAGELELDRSGEKPFLLSFLKLLDVPVSSQLLVFSTTSLQLRFITPSNPRALYFNEDIYVGYIPGGRIEVVSVDADMGGIFYIFDIPTGSNAVRIDRSERCMNCHAGEDTGYVPGLLVRSVAPAAGGGSLDSFRRGKSGHGVPLDQRLGGWYVTGTGAFTNHWGNALGSLNAGVLSKVPNLPADTVRLERYPLPSSDLLPHLLHEHQVGFMNRAIEAGYRARTHLHNDDGTLTSEHGAELDDQARLLVRYLLFADEVSLPAGGVAGEAAFREDFLRNRRPVEGKSLKDFDLTSRLFKHRCSYMIYSAGFTGLPPVMKERVYRRLALALNIEKPDAEYAYLPTAEKQSIHRILVGTLKDLPAGW